MPSYTTLQGFSSKDRWKEGRSESSWNLLERQTGPRLKESPPKMMVTSTFHSVGTFQVLVLEISSLSQPNQHSWSLLWNEGKDAEDRRWKASWIGNVVCISCSLDNQEMLMGLSVRWKKNLTTGFSYNFQGPYKLKSQQPWEHRLAGDPQAAIIQKPLSSEAGREKASSSAPSRFL